MPLTPYMQDKIMDDFVGSTVGLFTVAPVDGDGGTEVVGGGYTQRPSTLAQSLTDPGEATNTGALIFSLPECDVVAVGVFNTTGDLIWYDNLPTPKSFSAGATATIAPNAIVVNIP